jgi:hypothetical protein
VNKKSVYIAWKEGAFMNECRHGGTMVNTTRMKIVENNASPHRVWPGSRCLNVILVLVIMA